MRLASFLLGIVCGVALAPASGRETGRRLRDGLASLIDAALRVGIAAPMPGEKAL